MMTTTCVCRELQCDYTCGECKVIFGNICELYLHVKSHITEGSFYFDDQLKIAYPKTLTDFKEQLNITSHSVCTSDFIPPCNKDSQSSEYLVIKTEAIAPYKNDTVSEHLENMLEKDDYNNIDKELSTHSSDTDDYGLETDVKLDNDLDINIGTIQETSSIERKKHKKYKCQFCDESFISSYYLAKHQKVKHKAAIVDKEIVEDIYECEVCGRCYSTRPALFQHHKDKHPALPLPRMRENKNTVRQYYRYKCDYCDTKYSIWPRMLKHFRTQHTDNQVPQLRRMQCELCSAEPFTDYALFRQHLEQQHNIIREPRSYLCEVCGFAANTEDKIKTHRRGNCRENRFECDVCTFGCFDKTVFRLHYKTHTGEKDFVCQICGRAFGHHSTLSRHIITHTDQRPYQCEICKKTFRTSCVRTRHLLLHKSDGDYTCDICNKRFRQKSNMEAHHRQHTGLKPYKCDYCEEGFTHNVSRKNHMFKKHQFHTDAGPDKNKMLNSLI